MSTPAASSMTIRRYAGAEAARGLSSVAATWPDLEEETRQAIRQAATAAGRGEVPIVLAADDRDQLCGIVIAHVLPGRVASLIPPTIKDTGSSPAVARDLLLRLDSELSAAGVELVQTLLAA